MKVLVFGGTTEGRNLCQHLISLDFNVTLCVATEYGQSKINEKPLLSVVSKRMDKEEMEDFIVLGVYDFVIDATHPYADIVTENIKVACNHTNTKLLRLLRGVSENEDGCFYVKNTKEAIEILEKTKGNIFLTVGSKTLEEYTKLEDYNKRCFVRVIPMVKSLEKCIDLGFDRSKIICMEGPFSAELNQVMFKMSNATYVITKDSGHIGGFKEKIIACRNLGIKVIIIRRPNMEEGYLWEEILDFFRSL